MERNALERQFTAASLLRFALPNIIMMVFLSLYTIVDGMFISRYVGTLALSAVNMSYPLSSVQLAAGIMLGTGGSAVIARKLGEGKEEEARQDFTWIVLAAAGMGVIFMLGGNAFLPQILNLLGTSAAQFPFCLPYTRILLWFAPAMFLQTAFQVLFVTAGRPGLGLAATAAGGVSNIVLDALFMGMSIYASALFTAFSNGVVSAVISFARTFLFLVGALLLLPSLLGRTGIWLAVPTAELLGLAVSGAFLLWGKRRYGY